MIQATQLFVGSHKKQYRKISVKLIPGFISAQNYLIVNKITVEYQVQMGEKPATLHVVKCRMFWMWQRESTVTLSKLWWSQASEIYFLSLALRNVWRQWAHAVVYTPAGRFLALIEWTHNCISNLCRDLVKKVAREKEEKARILILG